jgi:hypothetical protein
MLVPIVAAVSARTFCLYLRLRVPPLSRYQSPNGWSNVEDGRLRLPEPLPHEPLIGAGRQE